MIYIIVNIEFNLNPYKLLKKLIDSALAEKSSKNCQRLFWEAGIQPQEVESVDRATSARFVDFIKDHQSDQTLQLCTKSNVQPEGKP